MTPDARPNPVAVADAIHSAAIHLLRGVRKEDEQAGVGPARLSALSLLVFGGPMRLTALGHATPEELTVVANAAAILERVSAAI